MHPVQDKLNLERDEISGAGWILSRPTIRRSDDKSQRFSRKISGVTTCSTLLQISLKLCQKMREKKDLVKNKIASYSKRTNSSKNGELAARNSQLAWTFNKRSSRWKPQTNLQQRIRLKSGRHASATIFFSVLKERKRKKILICNHVDYEYCFLFLKTTRPKTFVSDEWYFWSWFVRTKGNGRSREFRGENLVSKVWINFSEERSRSDRIGFVAMGQIIASRIN